MKKSTKGILAVLGTAVFGGIIYHIVKKESAKLKAFEEARRKTLEESGISEDIVEDCLTPFEDGDMVKSIYAGVSRSVEWDETMFSLEDVLENSHVLHLSQSMGRDRRTNLDFIFEIPNTACRSRNNSQAPKIGDYILTLKGAAEYMEKEIIKFTPRARYGLTGYFVIAFTDEAGEENQILSKIPACCYSMFKTEKRDGLTDFIQFYHEGRLDKSQIMVHEEAIIRECGVAAPAQIGKSWSNIKVLDVVLTWGISFPIVDTCPGGNPTGINLETAFACLKYLTELKICLNQDADKYEKAGKEYRSIMFNAYRSDLGSYDLLSGYEYHNGSIEVESCGYSTQQE